MMRNPEGTIGKLIDNASTSFIAYVDDNGYKQLLFLEIFTVTIVSVILISLVFVASFVQMANWLRIALIVIGFIPFVIGIGFAIRIEQTAGYYECAKCGYRYVPSYKSVLMSAHINRTRYMRCPKCNEKSWQKKVISKE